nr:hypothetical protein [Campylobacter mucosalis]
MKSGGRVICPYCGTGCEVELFVENNHIKSAVGVQSNPVNEGSLCLKGAYGWGLCWCSRSPYKASYTQKRWSV